MFDYPEASFAAQLRLVTTYGLPFEVQQRIGALIAYFGMFESYLEWAIWALKGVDPQGLRPSTDTKNVSAMIDECREACEKHPALAQIILLACRTGEDLSKYRNAIAHGFLMPRLTPESKSGLFMTNLRWHGEIRKRPSQDAHVDQNYLDLAVYSAATIANTMMAVYFHFREPSEVGESVILQYESDLVRAKSIANELRHATYLINQEKY